MNVGGEIGYYGLGEWSATELTEAERTRLGDVFHPMGSPNPRPLTEGKILRREGLTATPHGFLSALIGWLRATPEDRVTRRKIRAKKRAAHTPKQSSYANVRRPLGGPVNGRSVLPVALSASVKRRPDISLNG